MRDLFRVALVHLAAIGLDKKFWHGRVKMIHGQSAFVQDTTQNLKLAHFPARSPLPVAALPSMSLIPSAPFTNSHELKQRYAVRDNSCKSCLKSRHADN